MEIVATRYAADSPVNLKARVPWLAFNGARGELVPPAQLDDLTDADHAAQTHVMPEPEHGTHYENDLVPGDGLHRTVLIYTLDWLLLRI